MHGRWLCLACAAAVEILAAAVLIPTAFSKIFTSLRFLDFQ